MQEDAVQRYKDSIIVFLEVMYFFYSVAPSVSASYKFCAAIILLCRFSEAQLGPYQHTIKQRVFDLSVSLLDSDAFGEKADVENFIFYFVRRFGVSFSRVRIFQVFSQ